MGTVLASEWNNSFGMTMFQTTSIILFLVAAFAMGAFMVRLGCGMVAGFKPTMQDAAKAMFLSMLACLPLSISMGLPPVAKSPALLLGLGLASLVVVAYVLGARLKHPQTGAIGMGKGFAVLLAWWGVAIVGSLVLGLFASAVMKDDGPKPGDNFADCLLLNLPKMQNDAAAGASIQACRNIHPGGFDAVPQGMMAGSGKYKNGDECAASLGASTPSLRAGQVIYASCNKLYNANFFDQFD